MLCAAALVAILAGCSSERLASVPPPHVPPLAGTWTLDPKNSEAIDTAVVNLQAQLRKRVRSERRALAEARGSQQRRDATPRRGRERDRDQGASSADIGAAREPGVEVRASFPGASLVREFLDSVPVGSYLGIRLTPGRATVLSAKGSQECDLGIPAAVVLGSGTAVQTCGWRKRDFLIEQRPSYGPTLTERFGLDPGGELVMTLRLAGRGIAVSLVRRYRRTPHAVPPQLVPTGN